MTSDAWVLLGFLAALVAIGAITIGGILLDTHMRLRAMERIAAIATAEVACARTPEKTPEVRP